MDVAIQPFQPSDQAEVKALILAGLVEHWGFLDATKNPDLNDIQVSYRGATFLVARQGERVVGCGALVPCGGGVGEIVRMSVARDLRRCGLGRTLLARLVEQARCAGLQCVVLETTATWGEVITFYLSFGFHITHTSHGETYFELQLP